MGINTKKICCLYVSNWHLSVMLVPYINKQINEDVGITTIFKNEVGENIKTLLEKLNLKNTKEILNLDYENKEPINYEKIEKTLEKIIGKQEIIIITNGEKQDIELTNNYIEKYIQKNKISNKKIKIINCFDISIIKPDKEELLLKYNKILNTSGENDIEKLLA